VNGLAPARLPLVRGPLPGASHKHLLEEPPFRRPHAAAAGEGTCAARDPDI